MLTNRHYHYSETYDFRQVEKFYKFRCSVMLQHEISSTINVDIVNHTA